MTQVLVSDPIDQAGIDILGQVAQVDQRTGLSEDELISIIGDYDGLMIRSGTQVTAAVVAAATKLKIIGRAGVGVDNVDIPAATKRGVLVVNSPEGNTIAAAEHALAMMLTLSRHIPQAHAGMRIGKWDRKKYVGNELYKKIPASFPTIEVNSNSAVFMSPSFKPSVFALILIVTLLVDAPFGPKLRFATVPVAVVVSENVGVVDMI